MVFHDDDIDDRGFDQRRRPSGRRELDPRYGSAGYGRGETPGRSNYERGRGERGFGGSDDYAGDFERGGSLGRSYEPARDPYQERGSSRSGNSGGNWDSSDNRGSPSWRGPRPEHGEDVGGSQSFRGRGPKGYRRSDDRIREEACDCLTDDSRIDASEIECTVKNGEVVISGTVRTREERRRIEDVLERLSGVQHVQNNVRVKQDEGSTAGRTGSASSAATQTSGSATAGAQAPAHERSR